MKTKNLKKLILLGMSCLLTANFSALGMESDSDENNNGNEINININNMNQEIQELLNKIVKKSDDEFYESLLLKNIESLDKVQEIYETTTKEYEEVKKLYDNLCKEAENLEFGKTTYNKTHDYFQDYIRILKFVGLSKENKTYLNYIKYNPYKKETYESNFSERYANDRCYDKNDEFTKYYLTPALIKLDCALNYNCSLNDIKNLNPELQQRNEELKNNIIELHNKIRFLKNEVSGAWKYSKYFQIHIDQSIKNIIYSVIFCSKYFLEKNRNDLDCKLFLKMVNEIFKEPNKENKKNYSHHKLNIIKYTPKSIDELETNIEELRSKLDSADHLFKIMPGHELGIPFSIEPSWLRSTFIELKETMKDIVLRTEHSFNQFSQNYSISHNPLPPIIMPPSQQPSESPIKKKIKTPPHLTELKIK